MRSTITTTKTSNWLYFRQAASMINTKINKKNDIKTSTNHPDLPPAGGQHDQHKVNKKNDIKITTKTTLIFYLQATSMNCRLCRALCSCWRWRRNFGCKQFFLMNVNYMSR